MVSDIIAAGRRFSLSQLDGVKVALLVVLAGLIGYVYWGQRVEGEMTTYQWLTGHWRNVSLYSHGPLIPLIALGLAWWKRQEIFAQVMQPVSWGAIYVAVAMMLYYGGVKAVQPRVTVISFVLLLYGLTYTLAGRGLFRSLFFPISFLFLMIPLNFLEERVAVPLRFLMAWAATGLLNLLGIETIQRGTAIISPNVFSFDIANPCSGIQSLMALTTVTAAYAYVTQTSQWKRWLLFLSALPLAVLGNLVRVVGIALIAQNFGTKTAMELHDSVAGFIVFAVAWVAMVGIGWLLDFPYRQVWARWTKPADSKLETT
jgi:exosortase